MFEYCKFIRCSLDNDGTCSALKAPCRRQVDENNKCVHAIIYLKCAFAFHDNDGVLRCGFDTTNNTKRYVPGLFKYKYEKKLAIDDLPRCLKEIIVKKKGLHKKSLRRKDLVYDDEG